MTQHRTAEVSEAEIAVHWQEETHIPPPKEFVAQANLTDKAVFERFSLDNFPDCFKEYANLLDWYRTWDVTLDTSKPPFWRWFVLPALLLKSLQGSVHVPPWRGVREAVPRLPESNKSISHLSSEALGCRQHLPNSCTQTSLCRMRTESLGRAFPCAEGA